MAANLKSYLWEFVQKVSDASCWEWKHNLFPDGYGKFHVKGKTYRAHRIAWELTYGPIPAGLYVCHHCDNRKCCNPAHLFLGTHTENMVDMVTKGRARAANGTNNSNAKRTIVEIQNIRAEYAQGVSQKELARRYNISTGGICDIVHRKRWKDV